MSSRYNGIPKAFFETCVGVVLISVVEAGFIFSGTGIILRKKEDGSWPPPSACGLTGLGWGFLIGASLKDLIVFVMDEGTLESMTANKGIKLGTQSEVTIGPLGRTYQFDSNLSLKNFGPTLAVAFSKGAFLGLSVSGSVIGPRPVTNNTFYGRDITTKEILYGDNVILPQDKVTLIEEVHSKLTKLAQGMVQDSADAAEEAKKASAKSVADAAGEASKSDPDVVQVDAAAEAAKESS